MNDKSDERNNIAKPEEDLEKLITEVGQRGMDGVEHEESEADELIRPEKVDILNLPPRTEVHKNKKGRTNVKISRPFVRFITVIIMLIIVTAGAYFFIG